MTMAKAGEPERATGEQMATSTAMQLKTWLPESFEKALRPLPQWVPVSLDKPQRAIQVRFSAGGQTSDGTTRCVVASLAPLRVAVGLPTPLPERANGEARLSFHDTASEKTLGQLRLQFHAARLLDTGVNLTIFDVTEASHRCTRGITRAWNTWLHDRAFRRRSRDTAGMTPKGFRQLMIFYICPRPVVLVSVAGEHHSNLFPMDLIGAVSEDRFTLALRSTSASIPTMRATRRVAISDMPASLTPVIYRLGGHHKKPIVDSSELPFDMRKSSLFSLPHPANALRVRELEILSCDEVGSHTLFVTRTASDIRFAEGSQLFHVSGDYQHYRAKLAAPFTLAG